MSRYHQFHHLQKHTFWYNQTPKTRFICLNNKGFKPHLWHHLVCMQCGEEVAKPETGWIGQCRICGTLISFFTPTPIQQMAGLCESSILFNIGSYGSGKTTISCYLLAGMLRKINGARAICIAQTLQQLEKNAVSELSKFFHPSEFKKQTADIWVLKNNSVVEFWPSDDPDKLKSANANFIWIVEANTKKMQMMFNEALARIRNEKGFVYEYDDQGEIIYETGQDKSIRPKIKLTMNMIIVEANPEDKAWTNQMVYQAHTIIHTKNVASIDLLKNQCKPIRGLDDFTKTERNVDMVAILNATVDNPLLPDDYFTNLKARCKSAGDYDRIIYCDITAKEGLVFKDLIAHQDKYFKEINHLNWMNQDLVFIEALDPAGSNTNNDPEAYLIMLFDKMKRSLIILDEHKKSGLNLGESIRHIQNIRQRWNFMRQRELVFVADNALGKKYKSNSNYSLKSDYEIGLATGITLCNDKSIAHGIKQLLEWFDNGAIQISTRCEHLKAELLSYATHHIERYNKTSGTYETKEVFSEKENHLIDALRYAVVILESMGYKQYHHRIDYHHQMIAKNNAGNVYGAQKMDLNRFLPFGEQGLKPSMTPKKVFKL